MSKLVEEISSIIINENIEALCGYKYNNFISFVSEVNEINNKQNIEESLKNYILENDYYLSKKEKINIYNTTKEEIDKYAIEEIKYWVDDLYNLLGFSGAFNGERLKIANKLVDKLKVNKVKAYRLINSTICDGQVHEYSYLKDGIMGNIRCYETENERFIISFYGYD